jgi:hypothetical protein
MRWVRRLSKEIVIGVAVSALAVTAMAIDHLIGTDDEPGDGGGAADLPAFLLSVSMSLLLAAWLFGVVVRRAVRGEPDRAAKQAIVCALLAIPAMALLFLGLPFPLAGTAIALGFRGQKGQRRGVATAALVLGALVVAVGTGAYAAELLA